MKNIKMLCNVIIQGVRKLGAHLAGFLRTLENTFNVTFFSRLTVPFHDAKTYFNVSGCFEN